MIYFKFSWEYNGVQLPNVSDVVLLCYIASCIFFHVWNYLYWNSQTFETYVLNYNLMNQWPIYIVHLPTFYHVEKIGVCQSSKFFQSTRHYYCVYMDNEPNVIRSITVCNHCSLFFPSSPVEIRRPREKDETARKCRRTRNKKRNSQLARVHPTGRPAAMCREGALDLAPQNRAATRP